jgi:hypothetical protein
MFEEASRRSLLKIISFFAVVVSTVFRVQGDLAAALISESDIFSGQYTLDEEATIAETSEKNRQP